jgi:hypothetical protein
MYMDAETEELDSLLTNINQRVAFLGGYMEKENIHNGSSYYGGRARYAELTVRIPAQNLDQFVDHVAEAANITSKSRSTDNITLSYVATQSRITALETEQTRLLELLAKAETMDDLLKIESRLTDVRTQLEQVTSQLKLYDNLVDYSTVELDIREVQEYTEVEEPGVWTRLGNGFVNSLQNAGKILLEFVILLVCALPYLIFPAVVTVVILLIVKFSKRKKKNISEKQT